MLERIKGKTLAIKRKEIMGLLRRQERWCEEGFRKTIFE